ncbi:zonadhesin [Hemicordylus capensis]|uniref:zonadhesin n=1 Tax=Hemicordylus capensis TaxID=884348 RepID=UPI0023028DB8|nr:zonadhesin [Hemicordylus capensis]
MAVEGRLLGAAATLTSCDFDDPESPFCDWIQPKDDGAEWLRGEGQKPGESPGPPGGHPERRGSYIYPEARGAVQLQSPDLNPATSEVCVEFLYYLYGLEEEDQLGVNVQDPSGNTTTLWSRRGLQSSAWLLGAVTVQNPVQRPFKVVFSATRVETSEIGLALDTISVRVGPCSPCVAGCNFDTLDDLCQWENPPEGDTQWEQWVGSGDQPGVGPEDDFSRPGFGAYMLLDSLAPESSGAALLKSPRYHSPGGCLSLSFHYTLHGVSNDTALKVYAAPPGAEAGSPLLSFHGEHGPRWNPGAVNYTGTAEIQFVIEGIYRGKPGLAIDSVRISPCEEIFAQCDFNNNKDPFCGWVQPEDNDASWTRTNQTTPTEETGPPGDYPHGEGYYIYAEGGSLKPGQSMRLSSRAFCTDTDACVEFYYYMFGIVEVQTQLRVLMEGPSGAAILLWTRTGVQSPEWLLGSVSVPYGGPQPSKVIFETVRGSSPYLDVALDNISVRRGPCTATGAPTPPPIPEATASPGGPTAPAPSPQATTSHSRPTTTSTVPWPAATSSTAGRPTAGSQGPSASPGPVAPSSSRPATTTQKSPTAASAGSSTTTRGHVSSTTTTTTTTAAPAASSPTPSSSAQSTRHPTPAPIRTSTVGTAASHATSTVTVGHSSESPSRATTGHATSTINLIGSPTTPSSHATPSSSQAAPTSHPRTSATRPHTETSHVHSSPSPSGPRPSTTVHRTTTSQAGPSTTAASHITPGYSKPSLSSPTTASPTHPLSSSSSTGLPATPGHTSHASSPLTSGHPGSSQSTTGQAGPSVTSPATGHSSSGHTSPSTAGTSAPGLTSGSTSTSPASPSRATSPSPQISTTPIHAHPSTTGPHTEPSHIHSSPSPGGPSPSTTVHRTTSPAGPRTTVAGQNVTLLTTSGHSKPSPSSPTTASPTRPLSSSSSTGLPATPGHTSHASSPLTSGHPDSSQSTTGQAGPPATSPATGHSSWATGSSGHTSPSTAGTSAPSLASGSTSTSSASPSRATSPSPQISTTPIHAHPSTTGPHTEPSHVHSSSSPVGPSPSTTVHRTTSPASPSTTVAGQNVTLLTTPGHSKPSPSSPTTAGHASPSAGSTPGHGNPQPTSSAPSSPSSSSSSSQPSSSTTGQTSPTTADHVHASTATPKPTTTPSGESPTATRAPPAASPTVPGGTTPHARPTTPATHPTVPGQTTWPASTRRSSTPAPLRPSTPATKPTSVPETSRGPTATRETPALPPARETCTISGDPHYTTYDGRLFHFMGTCTYLLSAVCNATTGLPAFRVEATNEHRGANYKVSYVKSVSVEVYGARIVLLKGRRVTLDGKRVSLPASVADGRVLVRLSGTFVLVQADFGLWVRFDGNHHAEVSAPSPYSGQLCGLCGNYNGQVSDDNLMPNGTSAGTDADRLGESWQVPDAGDAGCTNTGDPGECDKDIAAEAQKPTSCGILTDPQGPFAPCHSRVPPEGPFRSCVYDLCGTGGDAGSLCFALQSYADRCAQAGIPIAWRNSSFCPLNCPPGSSYTPCGPACPATCTDPATSQNSCSGVPCVEGCVCDEGYLLSGDQCVPVDQCGCTDASGQYHPVGESWMGNGDCTQRCLCASRGNISCEEWSCSPVQECRPAEGLLGCQDAARETCTISGDPHYTTYDGRLFHFMGTCTYLLSAVCNATTGLPAFRVEATNEHRGANYKVSYVKSVSVEVYGARIVLLKGRRVTLDGKRVSLPASVADGRVLVRLSGTFVLVQADFGLWVRFDGNHHAEVSAPSPYSGQLCGLCGNYNGQVSDDNLMPNGTSAGTDADRLGESWQVPDAGDAGCTNTGDPGECDKDIAAEAQKPTSCGILTDPQGPFAPCHSRVPPEGPFRSCVYDLCGTGGDAGSLCFALQSYADRCAQAGIPIAWRNSSFCPLNCPPGSSYTPCGPACPATCTDPATSQNSCSGVPCVEGCVCDEGYLLSGDQCVPVEQCGCTDASGQYHPVGESWMGNRDCTQRCLCASRGNISCEEWSCSPIQECRPAEGLLGCQDAGVAACHVAGDPHYYTFDGAMVSFMGTCTYTLVMVCHGDPRLPSFNITAKNEERGQPEASYLRSVTVEVAGATVTLQKSRRVLIDGLRVRTPVEGQIPGVSITTSGIYVVLETDFGLVVKFDGNHHLEIQLPGTYFGKVCGMCGNFNNQSQDELLMPNGHLASNASQFGNSWKAPGDADPGCQPDDREDLEPRCTPQEMERLRPSCWEILGPKYQACHSVIDPQPFLKNCLFDLCEYQGMASVLCDNLQSYVEACKSQGVAGLSWRNSTFCPLPCQPHSRYSECTSPCPATCANLYAPASCLRLTACVEGCACDRGYVLSDDSCVSMRDCGCLDNHQEYHSPGDSWVTAGCLQRCSCLDNGKITCQPLQCLPGSHCALSATGERYCRPAKFHRCVVSGDPHYRTFDAFVHHFQGRATYTLTRTLGGLPGALEALSVAGRNRRRFPLQRVSFLREVYVSVYGYRVTLMQGRKLAVNGVKVTPPFYPRDGLQITQRGRSLLLQTDFGFSVSFDGKDFAEIVLPSTYQDRVGGLCGNYDGQRNNEYMKPDGTWTRNLNTFGNSWQVSSQRTAPGLEAGSHSRARREEPEEEVESGFEVDCSPEQLAHVNGTEVCGVLSDPQGPFAACHGIVPPSSSQENCVYDLCALFNDTELLCQEYEAYAWACQEDGVALGLWRQKTGCEMSCPAHTTYKPCMTACPASCANMAAQSDCEAPCVEGCASDPGYILSGLDSVPYNQCGCSHSDQYYQINDTFLTEDCSQRCTCRNTEMLVCQKAGCSDGELCAVANYTRGCFKEGPCLSNPCQNEGICEETSGSFQCLCLEGYVGPLCEEMPFDVLPSPTAPPSASATFPPSMSATPPTSGKTEHLTVILLGVLLPLGLILIVVAVVCICQRRNKKKTEEDHLDILSAAEAPDASGKRVTRF